jgi:hypothetical protein
MTFKNFCYEMWLEYMEECLCYNHMASPYKDWIRSNKWYLRKTYRLRYNKLKSEWKPDYERFLHR